MAVRRNIMKAERPARLAEAFALPFLGSRPARSWRTLPRSVATQADVRRLALALPGSEQPPGRFAFSVRNKGKLKAFVWVWMERIVPKKPRVPNHGVLAVRVADLAEKDRLLAADPAKFFTEPHYAGFPAVLVRLDAVTVRDLRPLISAAWRCQAPADLAPRARGGRVDGPKPLRNR
jgi:hypothetical protein